MPRMSSRLDRMEPSSDACTMRISSLERAMIKMISSTALPNVTFMSAPIASPICAATLSVAKLSRPASGTMATAFMLNATGPLRLSICATAMPTGTKISSTLIQLDVTMVHSARPNAWTKLGLGVAGEPSVRVSPLATTSAGGFSVATPVSPSPPRLPPPPPAALGSGSWRSKCPSRSNPDEPGALLEVVRPPPPN
jgi:hypothetical protein